MSKAHKTVSRESDRATLTPAGHPAQLLLLFILLHFKQSMYSQNCNNTENRQPGEAKHYSNISKDSQTESVLMTCLLCE